MNLSENYIIKPCEGNLNINNITSPSLNIDNSKQIDSSKQIKNIKVTVCLTNHKQCSGKYSYNNSLKLSSSIANNNFRIICLCKCHNIKNKEIPKNEK